MSQEAYQRRAKDASGRCTQQTSASPMSSVSNAFQRQDRTGCFLLEFVCRFETRKHLHISCQMGRIPTRRLFGSEEPGTLHPLSCGRSAILSSFVDEYSAGCLTLEVERKLYFQQPPPNSMTRVGACLEFDSYKFCSLTTVESEVDLHLYRILLYSFIQTLSYLVRSYECAKCHRLVFELACTRIVQR